MRGVFVVFDCAPEGLCDDNQRDVNVSQLVSEAIRIDEPVPIPPRCRYACDG